MKKLNPGPGKMADMSKLLLESGQKKTREVEVPTPEQLEAAFGTFASAVYYTAVLSKNRKGRGGTIGYALIALCLFFL